MKYFGIEAEPFQTYKQIFLSFKVTPRENKIDEAQRLFPNQESPQILHLNPPKKSLCHQSF
jgi:hypothetical protein